MQGGKGTPEAVTAPSRAAVPAGHPAPAAPKTTPPAPAKGAAPAKPPATAPAKPAAAPSPTQVARTPDAAMETAEPLLVPPPATPHLTRVALLLPLSGSTAELARGMLNAAQMALFDFADDRFELVFHDTQGTPDGAARAAALAIGDGAAMILGPLLASSVNAVAPAARAAGVNVIAFSSDRSVAGDGIYTMGFLPGAEIERVVGYARAQGILRFAALAPDNDYGATAVGALERAVEKAGGVLTRIEFYDPYGTDFSEPVRRLANYSARRSALLAQRAQLEERGDEVARRALKRLEKLQTIGNLPFDALFLADGGKRLQAIAALLPFYDVDPGKIRILGTGQWDEPGMGTEPGLVGGWFAAPPPAARAEFEKTYQDIYGERPPRLATLAYDATALAAVIARSGEVPDFGAAALITPNGFAGRDGIFRFLAEGVTERGLAVTEVRERGFKVIEAAPEAFAPAVN